MEKALRETKRKNKTITEWKAEAQAAFNEYIRTRDSNKPCVSCGRFGTDNIGGYRDAGHYRSRGSAPLNFHLLNCWGQCKQCNRHLSGNIVEYRKTLIKRIGPDRLVALDHDNSNPLERYGVSDYQRIKRIFRRRARHYKRLTEENKRRVYVGD